MGLITFARNLKRAWNTETAMEIFGAGDNVSMADVLNVPGGTRAAENIVLVYGCIVARRDAVGGVPLKLVTGDGEEIAGGPLADLLAKPNREQNWGQYVRQLETYCTLYNTIAVALVGEPGRAPDELIALNPGALRAEMGVHAVTGTPVPKSWEYADPDTGIRRTFESGQIMIQQGFNPHAPLRPLSPLKVLSKTISQEGAAREMNLATMKNDIAGSMILEGPQGSTITKEQADELAQRFSDKYGGFKAHRKPVVLWGGVKANRELMTPQEMEYLTGLKFLRNDYYMVFRVYPAMLGEMTGETGLSQGSSTDSQKVAWWEDVGLPELALIAGLHQAFVVDAYEWTGARKGARLSELAMRSARRSAGRMGRALGGTKPLVYFEENAIPALARHRLTKTEQLTKLAAIGYRPDDINEFLDLGLPEHPDNMGRVAFALQEIGAGVANAESGTGNAGAKPRAVGLMEQLEVAIRAEAGKPTKFEKFLAPLEKAAAKRWSGFFVEQRGRVLKRLADTARSDTAQSLLDKVFPLKDEDMHLVGKLAPLWAEHLKAGHDKFAAETKIENPFVVDSPNVQKAIEARKAQSLLANDTTSSEILDIFAKGLAEGSTNAMLGDEIAKYYADNCIGSESNRPLTAARTQTAGLVNEGELIAAKEAGGLLKYWIHGSPKDPRESHVKAAADYGPDNAIGLEDDFVVDGEHMQQPGDSNADIKNVANCTCSLGFKKAS